MGLSGTHNYGNYFRRGAPDTGTQPVELDGDTIITGGNYTLCHVTTNGHSLDIQGGNVRGLYIDGVKQDDYVWQRFEPLAQAVALNDTLRAKGGAEGVEAFQVGIIEWIHANPAASKGEWESAYVAEALTRGWFANVTTLQSFVADYFSKTTWASFVVLVLNYTLDQWAGKDTELVEEYS